MGKQEIRPCDTYSTWELLPFFTSKTSIFDGEILCSTESILAVTSGAHSFAEEDKVGDEVDENGDEEVGEEVDENENKEVSELRRSNCCSASLLRFLKAALISQLATALLQLTLATKTPYRKRNTVTAAVIPVLPHSCPPIFFVPFFILYSLVCGHVVSAS